MARSLGSLAALVDRDAVRDSVPLLVPAVPFGFVLGVEISNSLMPLPFGVGTSWTVFAGAAQLAMITLAGTVSAVTVILTALVINARHVMYSAALAPTFAKQPRWFRVLAPAVLIDQIFALSVARTDQSPERFRRYYITCGAMFFTMWQVLTVAGIVFGSSIPASWGLGLAPALMFAGIVVSMAVTRPAVVAASTAVVVTLLTIGLPNRSGLLVGALAGVAAGFLVDRGPRP